MTDTSTNALFIITSATNAPYTTGANAQSGPNSRNDAAATVSDNHGSSRPEQTASYDALMATIQSINTHAPGSRIALVEYSAYPLTEPQHNALIEHVDYLMSYAGNEQIQQFDRNLGSHPLIAAFSEMTCLLWFLQVGQHHDLYQPFKRVFKLSPGVQLTSAIKDTVHFADRAQLRYVFPNATLASNADGALAMQFSNAYWSLDAALVPSFIALLQEMLQTMFELNKEGKPICVESLLYKCIDAGKIFYDLKPSILGA